MLRGLAQGSRVPGLGSERQREDPGVVLLGGSGGRSRWLVTSRIHIINASYPH